MPQDHEPLESWCCRVVVISFPCFTGFFGLSDFKLIFVSGAFKDDFFFLARSANVLGRRPSLPQPDSVGTLTGRARICHLHVRDWLSRWPLPVQRDPRQPDIYAGLVTAIAREREGGSLVACFIGGAVDYLINRKFKVTGVQATRQPASCYQQHQDAALSGVIKAQKPQDISGSSYCTER